MSYSDNVTAASDSTFVNVVRAAMFKYALEVVAEDPTTAQHDNRVTLAGKVLASPDGYVQQFALACAVIGGVIMANIRPMTDDQIDAAVDQGVAGVWNAFLGA